MHVMTVPAFRVRWEVTIFGTFAMFTPKGVGAGVTTKILRIFHCESALHFHLGYGQTKLNSINVCYIGTAPIYDHTIEDRIVTGFVVKAVDKHFSF